jgi:signal transduction histidine kinase
VCSSDLEGHRAAADAKGLSLRLELHANLPSRVTVDPLLLVRLVSNLVGNAVKFSDGGAVRVEAGALGDSLTVSVSDRGIGIRLEDQAKLFHPFQQIDMSSTKAYEGTGLGLYLCRLRLWRIEP